MLAQPQRSPLGLWITIERPMTDLLPCSFTWLGLGLGLGLGIGLGLGLGLGVGLRVGVRNFTSSSAKYARVVVPDSFSG